MKINELTSLFFVLNHSISNLPYGGNLLEEINAPILAIDLEVRWKVAIKCVIMSLYNPNSYLASISPTIPLPYNSINLNSGCPIIFMVGITCYGIHFPHGVSLIMSFYDAWLSMGTWKEVSYSFSHTSGMFLLFFYFN